MELKLSKITHTPPWIGHSYSPPAASILYYDKCMYIFPNSNVCIYYSPRNLQTQYRRWDSNAESFRAQNFNYNPKPNNDDDDDDDEAGEWFEVLGELLDGAWIFPVFKSFGWFLPAIISSLLITSGPKAFLMALAVPLGQSAISLAFQAILGRRSKKPKRTARTRRKPRARYARKVKLDEEEEEETQEASQKDSVGYQTWVGENDFRVDKDSPSSPRFGGWDDLDRRSKTYSGSEPKSAQNSDKPHRSKLSRGRRKGETPLLLRLLIAVFPFLGSWTKIL